MSEDVKRVRPSKIEYYMKLAEDVAMRSHDAETQVGMLLVRKDTGAIIATGYNGYIRGADDASLPNTRPLKYAYMMHAEDNIICHCARHGISMQGCFIVCPISPCAACTRRLWQCGISEAIVKGFHPTFEEVKKMLDMKVLIDPFENAGTQYYKLMYSPRMNSVPELKGA